MRINMNMPEELVKKVDERAKELYLSRSAFITMAVSEKLQADDVVKIMPDVLSAINNLKNMEDSKSDEK